MSHELLLCDPAGEFFNSIGLKLAAGPTGQPSI